MIRLIHYITHRRAVYTLPWCILILLLLACQPLSKRESEHSNLSENDHFPLKLTIQHAVGFQLIYHNHWKELQLYRHYNDQADTIRFALVMRGESAPEDFAKTRVLEIPLKRMATVSTTHLGMFEALNALPELKGIEAAQYVTSEKVKQQIEEGNISELAPSGMLNTEKVVAENIEVLMGVGYPNAQNDTYQSLENAGVPVLLNAEWQEKTLLGRAEWVKMLAALLNKEAEVTKIFEELERKYNEVLTQLEDKPLTAPMAITGLVQGDAWFVAGGKSFANHLMQLANVQYPWSATANTGSVKLDFETVYAYGLEADYWLVPSTAKTMEELLQTDSRFADFKSVNQQQVYNIYGRYTPGGGNDFYESAVMQPHIVLKDILSIFHPQYFPNHELVYYNRLK